MNFKENRKGVKGGLKELKRENWNSHNSKTKNKIMIIFNEKELSHNSYHMSIALQSIEDHHDPSPPPMIEFVWLEFAQVLCKLLQ